MGWLEVGLKKQRLRLERDGVWEGEISVYKSAKRLGYKPILGKKGLGKRGSNLGRGHGEGLEKGKGEEG